MNLISRTASIVAVLLAVTGCSAVRGEPDTVNFGSTESAAAAFDDVASSAHVSVGSASINEPGAGQSAIDFVSTELFSGTDIDGRELFGSGSVVATFVQPGCDFSAGHAEVIAAAASERDDVTFVFVHSGAAPESFQRFAAEAGLDSDSVVHLDDHAGELSYRFGVAEYPTTLLADADGQLSLTTGALDGDRMDQALELVSG